MVVVGRGVGVGAVVGCRAFAEAVADDVQVGVGEEAALVFIVQAVISDVLVLAGFRYVAECPYDVLHSRHAAPDGGVHIDHFRGGGQAVFIELASVAEDVFRDVAQVDVQLTGVVLVFFVGEGVHQPELDVFDVSGLKVGGLHPAHDTSPTA